MVAAYSASPSLKPETNAVQILRAIRRLPSQMRQRLREVHRVLTCAAADFQHSRAIRKVHSKHAQDRIAVAITSGSIGFTNHVLAKLGWETG